MDISHEVAMFLNRYKHIQKAHNYKPTHKATIVCTQNINWHTSQLIWKLSQFAWDYTFINSISYVVMIQ